MFNKTRCSFLLAGIRVAVGKEIEFRNAVILDLSTGAFSGSLACFIKEI